MVVSNVRTRIKLILLVVFAMCLTACGKKQSDSGEADVDSSGRSYVQIDQETAKEMMMREDDHVIVDVRRQDEYDAGHIPGAILIPNESIDKEQPDELPDLNQIILVYCRSGNRSKQASQKLADMGYTNVYEFGGINTWDGEIVTDEKSSEETVQ
ncbi:MAG: rhodanese-like domain-containing protein [Eubacterium sp.]|nr:rhodanese-like domain-containing protein [Eubacterium sp.]